MIFIKQYHYYFYFNFFKKKEKSLSKIIIIKSHVNSFILMQRNLEYNNKISLLNVEFWIRWPAVKIYHPLAYDCPSLSHVFSPIIINKSLLFVGIQSSATPPKTPQDTNNDVSIPLIISPHHILVVIILFSFN